MIDAAQGQRRLLRAARRGRDEASEPAIGWIGACVLALICGCGPRGPAVEMVEGIVLLDGTPVEGATVFFSPVTETSDQGFGLPAAGRTVADGSFRLNAGGGATPGAGTAVGDYIVTVIKQESDPVPPPDLDAPPAQPPEIHVRDLLPEIYKLGTSSPLRATVKKGRNAYRFELKSP